MNATLQVTTRDTTSLGYIPDMNVEPYNAGEIKEAYLIGRDKDLVSALVVKQKPYHGYVNIIVYPKNIDEVRNNGYPITETRPISFGECHHQNIEYMIHYRLKENNQLVEWFNSIKSNSTFWISQDKAIIENNGQCVVLIRTRQNKVDICHYDKGVTTDMILTGKYKPNSIKLLDLKFFDWEKFKILARYYKS